MLCVFFKFVQQDFVNKSFLLIFKQFFFNNTLLYKKIPFLLLLNY